MRALLTAGFIATLLLVASHDASAQTCVNECSTPGMRECPTNLSFRICGDFDADPCLEWGTPVTCPVGEACVTGVCTGCGLQGNPCCANNSCAVGLTCSNNTCIPAGTNALCAPCTGPSVCLPGALCISTGGPNFCGQDCRNSTCPPGYRCLSAGGTNMQCAPNVTATCMDCTAQCCPDCTNKECGFNGCNGSCGTCTGANEVCDANGRCVAPPDNSPPTTPTMLRVVGVTVSTIEIAWSPSMDDVAVAGYEVQRATDAVNYVMVGTTTTTGYIDTGLPPNFRVWYRVVAFDPSNNRSGATGAVNGTTSMLPIDAGPPPPVDSGVVLDTGTGQDVMSDGGGATDAEAPDDSGAARKDAGDAGENEDLGIADAAASDTGEATDDAGPRPDGEIPDSSPHDSAQGDATTQDTGTTQADSGSAVADDASSPVDAGNDVLPVEDTGVCECNITLGCDNNCPCDPGCDGTEGCACTTALVENRTADDTGNRTWLLGGLLVLLLRLRRKS